MRSIATAALVFSLLAAAWPLALRAQTAPEPAAQPVPTASPSPAPPPPGAAPLPAPAPATSPSASPYKYIVTPPAPAAGQPAVLEIDMLDSTIHAGSPYSVRVRTTGDVKTINVSAMGATYGMQQAAPGLFASDGQVPGFIPFFLLGRNYPITLVAQTADGRSTTVTLSLRLDR